MKIKTLHLVMTVCFLGLLPVKTVALNYTISFTGTGASSTVDSVIVQNLTKGTKVTVYAGDVLNLSDVPNAVESVSANNETICVYPASVAGKYRVSFFSKQAGSTQLNAFSPDGRKITGINTDLQVGINTFEVSLPRGVYIIQVAGNDYAYTAKILNPSNAQSKTEIASTGSEEPASSSLQKSKSTTSSITAMAYSTGDQLLYKGVSENYSTIVTDIPTDSKTTNFNFVACTDADGNNYTVVTIGTQTWMAENLKTTQFNDNTAIPFGFNDTAWELTSISPAYCWYSITYKNIYGELYNWYAVNTGKLAPIGWHVPADDEWITLENYLIANGYNYDGSSSGNYLAKSLASNTKWITFIPTDSGTVGHDLSKNNSSGFSALPGGYRIDGGFISITYGSYWWSSSECLTTSAWSRGMNCSSTALDRNSDFKNNGFSVRCVQDN